MDRPGLMECAGLVHPSTKGYGLACVFFFVALLALAAPALGATVTISPGQSIATAITDAGSGGTVILNPGTYYQYNIVVGNDVTIRADTANGHGPSDTIVDAERFDRIFDDSGNHALAIDNLTLLNGLASASSSGGARGGAIYTDSGTVTVISSTFTGCSASSNGNVALGGAIYTVSGTVTVTSSTFTGCTASSSGFMALGGAISTDSGSVTVTTSAFTGCSASSQDESLGGAIQTSSGSVTVTSSVFTACSATTTSSGSMAFGGAIQTTQGIVTVTSSTFTACSARSGIHMGFGSAINAESGGTVRFSRLVNNDIGTAIFNPVNAADNWWGSNSNPSGHLANGATAATWLVPGITASPITVAESGTSVISANLTYDNTGAPVAGGSFGPDGTLVRFTATGGTVSPEYVGTKDGIATTTFTPSGPGTATVTATVDGQSVSVPVTVTASSGSATAIAVDPGSASTVYAGIDNQGVYRTTDGGNLWTGATTQPGNTQIRALVINPMTHSRLFTGTYGGGVYQSTDSGDHWNTCSNTGLANLNVLSLVSDVNGRLYAGTENGVYTSADNCANWAAVNGGLP